MLYDVNFVLDEGAALLDQTNSIPLGNALRSLQSVKTKRNEKRTIAVIGLSNLKDTVNVLNTAFGYRFLDADRLAYVRKNIAIRFSHDTTASVEDIDVALQKLYSKLEADTNESVNAQIILPCDALEKADALLLFSEKIEDGDLWEAENAEFDFAFFAVNALGAFSINEKAFISKIASPIIGKKRLAIAVANTGFVSADDYKILRDSINAILRQSFESLPDIFADSSDELYTFWEKKLIPNIAQYHKISCDQILGVCVTRIIDTLSEVKKLIDVDSKQIDEAIETLKGKETDVREKSESLCHMAQIFINGNVKSPLINSMREYNGNIIANIFDGLNNAQNVRDTADKLPDFVSSAWNHFFSEQLPCINDMFDDEAERIKKQLKTDEQDVFTEVSTKVFGIVSDEKFSDILFSPFNLVYVTSKEHTTMSKVSSLLLVGSIPLAFVSLPIAVISAVCSFGIKRFHRKSDSQEIIIGSEEKREISLYANEICEELIAEVGLKLDEATEALKSTITETYKKMLGAGIASLNALRSSSSEMAEKRQFVLDFERKFVEYQNKLKGGII